MLFHSFTFALLLAATLLAHRLAPRAGKRWVLLAASLAFYAAWNPRYLGLLALSALIDYVAGGCIARSTAVSTRRWLLVASLSTNLGLLAVFKYSNFLIGAINLAAGSRLPLHHLLLPVGISFYTFQSMSYTIDIYRGQLAPARDFVDFFLFVSFFPQLVAGPIVRAREFLPQLARGGRRSASEIRAGILRFGVGLFRKLVIADNLGRFVDSIHAAPEGASTADLWIAAYAFAFQIYHDFAGYTDMAIGLAMLFGFRFPENFRRPYLAANVADFWRRWHITLSTWLRDYLYIPLGGSRRGPLATYGALLATMLLGGLWHGANWTFLAWGSIHGLALVIHRAWRQARGDRSASSRPLYRISCVLATFHVWTLSMVFFRSDSITTALATLHRMFSASGPTATGAGVAAACVALYSLQALGARVDLPQLFEARSVWIRGLVIAAAVWLLVLGAPIEPAPFLYFQF